MLELLARRERAAACRPGDGPGTAPSGAFPGRRTTDSELRGTALLLAPRPGLAGPIRAEDIVRIQASNRRLCSPPAPTHVRAFAPQGPVPLAQPARPTRRGGPPRSSLPNGRRAESFADDLKRDGALQNSPKSWEGVSSAEPRTPSRPSRGRSAPYRAQLRLALLAAWPAVVRP
uniref:Uncharacterized protein n=1 Tax=Zea mays TaxID=4577 RepID=A0A804RNC0_MAIZE